ncbi:MAG: hypothetical protein HY298_15005 [Verrucomicrobia bacterium]|nr:hypothetical protein [Verrucomicrobiota bacterium]
MNASFQFVGRTREVAQLEKLYSERKHVLILGLAGTGKTALISHVRKTLPVIVCPHTTKMTEACDALENELGLHPESFKLIQRKQKLFKVLAEARRTVVFDGVTWTTPKLSAFLDCVSERVPVWICCRSEHSWDIGHFWPFLWKFVRVGLQPFQLSETRSLVKAAVQSGAIPPDATHVIKELHHLSAGIPLVLRELFDELATRKYDPKNPFDLRLLDLDRRIHEIFPTATALGSKSNPTL